MKAKISAGAEIDFLNQDELKRTLSEMMVAWRVDAAKGDRYVDIRDQGLIGAAGDLTIGGASGDQRMGPREGYVWDIRRLCIAGLDYAGGDVAAVYRNESTPLSLLGRTDQVTRGLFLLDRQWVFYPGHQLVVVGASLSATGYVQVTGTVRELPISLAWRL